MKARKKSKEKIKLVTTRVKATTYKRNGKTIKRKAYKRTAKQIVGEKWGFMPLAKKVAKNYKGKAVPKKYQKKYGKRYSEKEAMEVGKRVAQKVRILKFKKKGAKLSR